MSDETTTICATCGQIIPPFCEHVVFLDSGRLDLGVIRMTPRWWHPIKRRREKRAYETFAKDFFDAATQYKPTIISSFGWPTTAIPNLPDPWEGGESEPQPPSG